MVFRVLTRLIPFPDLIIYLYSPSELIYNRKPELTIQEINRQADVCHQLIEHLPNAYLVDNSSHLDRTIHQIRDVALKKMVAQTVDKR